MMNRGIKKKISPIFLTIALLVTMLPKFSTPVSAATNELPTVEQFATVDELKSFNIDDTNDGTKNPAKVYFGDNSQQWWIAGSQNENLTLFAASPLATNQQFEPNWNQNKTYDSSWNCTYSGGSNPSEVNPNHYGASPLRNTLKNLETSYFTGIEQGLMNDTTIYTNDTKNSSTYSTTDKLYLAYGDYNDNQYITVGTNNSDSLNNDLRIDKDYWGNSGFFWLRAPDLNDSYFARVVKPGDFVFDDFVNYRFALVPAFELNLSFVLFGSAIPAVSNEGTLTNNDAFTLRYKSDSLGSALVSYDKSKVTLTNVPNGTYLVVQNKDGAKAKQIRSEAEVSVTDMGLDSFANCKVWLETTDTLNRMTYATLATQEKGVAEVNGVEYLTLKEAYENSQSGDTINILKNFDLKEQIMFEKDITLNLNNHKITVNVNYGIWIEDNCHITIVTGENGDIFESENVIVPYALTNDGILTVNGTLSCDIINDGTIKNGIFKGYVGNGGTIENGYYFKVSLLSGSIVKAGYFKERPFINSAVYDDYKFTTTNVPEFPYKVCPKEDVIGLNITLSENLSVDYNYLLTQYFEKANNNKKIEDIIIDVNPDYYLPENYFAELDKIEGLKYEITDDGFVILGVLSKDTSIVFDKPSLKANGNDVIGNPTVSNVGYKEGLTLKDITLPTGWVWTEPDTPLTIGNQTFEASYDTKKYRT